MIKHECQLLLFILILHKILHDRNQQLPNFFPRVTKIVSLTHFSFVAESTTHQQLCKEYQCTVNTEKRMKKKLVPTTTPLERVQDKTIFKGMTAYK